VATSNERMASIVEKLRRDPGLAEQLPAQEGAIVRDALEGQDVYAIAQRHRLSEAAVWDVLSNAARSAAAIGSARRAPATGTNQSTSPSATLGSNSR